MNNEHYLIHKDDYIKHIDEKVMLYSFVKQLTHHIAKLPPTQANASIKKMAGAYILVAEKLFDSWGIPGSYLVFGEEADLTELMENELIAPEDAGYYPIDDDEDDCACDFECRCGCCCGCCSDEDYGEDEDDEDINDFAEAMAELAAHIHSIFGNDVTFHIVID